MIKKYKRIIVIILFVFSILALAIVYGSYIINEPFVETYKKFNSIEVGMSENQVTNKLGQPTHVYFSSSAPKNYYVEGYSFKKRQITNKVYIYVDLEPIAYVYFDDNDIVEDTFVGGS